MANTFVIDQDNDSFTLCVEIVEGNFQITATVKTSQEVYKMVKSPAEIEEMTSNAGCKRDHVGFFQLVIGIFEHKSNTGFILKHVPEQKSMNLKMIVNVTDPFETDKHYSIEYNIALAHQLDFRTEAEKAAQVLRIFLQERRDMEHRIQKLEEENRRITKDIKNICICMNTWNCTPPDKSDQ